MWSALTKMARHSVKAPVHSLCMLLTSLPHASDTSAHAMPTSHSQSRWIFFSLKLCGVSIRVPQIQQRDYVVRTPKSPTHILGQEADNSTSWCCLQSCISRPPGDRTSSVSEKLIPFSKSSAYWVSLVIKIGNTPHWIKNLVLSCWLWSGMF